MTYLLKKNHENVKSQQIFNNIIQGPDILETIWPDTLVPIFNVKNKKLETADGSFYKN